MVCIVFVIILETILQCLNDLFQDKTSFVIKVKIFPKYLLSLYLKSDVHEKHDLGSTEITEKRLIFLGRFDRLSHNDLLKLFTKAKLPADNHLNKSLNFI
jgi:hypothetical protein